MSHTDIHSFIGLYKVVHEKGYNLATPGFFYNLRGHIGEWQAFRDFKDFQPSMPIASNQAGYDINFGDRGFSNVKVVGGNAHETIADHQAIHPGISIILNRDARNIPHDALVFNPGSHFDPATFHDGHSVIVDTSLTAAHTGAEAHNAIHHLQHPIAFHFPWITMAVSAVIEASLVARGNTTLGRAVKKTAVTTSAVGAGSLFGHAGAGAAGGLLFGPPGFLVGGLLGAVTGAYAGRLASKHVNGKPLRDARTAYEHRLAAFERNVADAVKHADQYWDKTMRTEDIRLTEELELLSVRADQNLSAARERDVAAQQLLQHGIFEDVDDLVCCA